MSRADEILREKLLEQFEAFRVERILAEIKKEWVFDESVTEFGERLKERTVETGNPGSTSHLRARALDPESLPAVHL